MTIRQKNMVLIGYVLFGGSFLGFYSVYLENPNQSSLLSWVIIMLIGVGILGWKNLQFTGKKQAITVGLDLLFILNFYLFSLWDMKYGLNFVLAGMIGAVIGSLTINYYL